MLIREAPNLQRPFEIIRKVVRGMHAIVNPAPGADGSTLSDVQYVHLLDYTVRRKDGSGHDLPWMGRSITMALRRGGSASKPVWQELVTDYMERLGMSESVRHEFDTIVVGFQNMFFKLACQQSELQMDRRFYNVYIHCAYALCFSFR